MKVKKMPMAQSPQNAIPKRFLGERFQKLAPEHRRLLERISSDELISRNTAELVEGSSTRWDRIADRMAEIGGSWAFIFGFLAVLASWIVLNTEVLPRWN